MANTISGIRVLNTVNDNGADAYVDSTGMLRITGGTSIRARNITNMTKTVGATETLQVWTITPTAQNSYHYEVQIKYYPNGLQAVPVIKTIFYDSAASGDTATTICDGLRTNFLSQIGTTYITSAAAGAATWVITAAAGYPIFWVYDDLNDSNVAVADTTPGVARVGYGADLTNTYYASSPATGTSPGLGNVSTITSTAYYTQWRIEYSNDAVQGGTWSGQNSKSEFILLINEAATTAGTSNATTNLANLQSTYGTLTYLKLGYKANINDNTTTTAAITGTTGVITLASGAVTFVTLDAQVGDVLMLAASGGTAFTTFVTTRIGSLVTSALLGSGNNYVAQSAVEFKFISVRDLPL